MTGISPREGPTSGGTRLVLRGCGLGRDRSDVVGLWVCGSNVLSTLDYVSSAKLICTTKPHHASTGKSTSSVLFWGPIKGVIYSMLEGA